MSEPTMKRWRGWVPYYLGGKVVAASDTFEVEAENDVTAGVRVWERHRKSGVVHYLDPRLRGRVRGLREGHAQVEPLSDAAG